MHHETNKFSTSVIRGDSKLNFSMEILAQICDRWKNYLRMDSKSTRIGCKKTGGQVPGSRFGGEFW